MEASEEVAPLAQSGADELYCGVLPDGWDREGMSANRRTFGGAQFASEADARAALELAGGLGLPVHVTLNAPFYDQRMLEALLELAVRLQKWGAAGFIGADPALLKLLSRELGQSVLTLSTMAGAMNHSALEFYRPTGISRAVLPRHLDLHAMQMLVDNSPGLEFEAFVLIGKCPNEEAYCTFQHVSPTKRWPCEIHYESHPGSGSAALAPLVAHQQRWELSDRRMGCGICGISSLGSIGVRILKLVGRGGPTAGKVANVELVRRYADAAASSASPDVQQCKDGYRGRFGRECSPEVCYFPELFQ